ALTMESLSLRTSLCLRVFWRGRCPASAWGEPSSRFASWSPIRDDSTLRTRAQGYAVQPQRGIERTAAAPRRHGSPPTKSGRPEEPPEGWQERAAFPQPICLLSVSGAVVLREPPPTASQTRRSPLHGFAHRRVPCFRAPAHICSQVASLPI